MSTFVTVDLFAVGAALLALWIVARFPSSGPRGVTGSVVVVIAGFVVLSVMSSLTSSAVVALGPAFTLLVLVLPTLTLTFWSCACLLRALVGLLSGR